MDRVQKKTLPPTEPNENFSFVRLRSTDCMPFRSVPLRKATFLCLFTRIEMYRPRHEGSLDTHMIDF
uniref:Uncharacterized protein n=1 Tax=Romanomermis culicivorax TaxID=13658 RepID=A0A915IM74_ROMCU